MGNSSKEWVIAVTGAIADELEACLNFGPILNDEGHRRLSEATVDRFDGLTVSIFSNEHPPPHFRVMFQDETANFRIKDCGKLNGGLVRYQRNIEAWWRDHRTDLIKVWNSTRPTNCPVGQYVE